MGAPSHTSLRRHALLGTTALFLIAGGVGGLPAPAFADFNDGTAAYEAGDYTRAYNEWLPLARAGNAAAQRNIGQLYRLGLGVPKDLKVAANWYRLAAEQGLARAQANLGVMYLRGEGVERDPVKAADWFAQAADQGHTISQYNLALMYEQGYGVARDKSQAARWFEQAAAGGHDKAGDRLAALLSESVIPAAGAPSQPEPALPVQTARAEEYVPARILNRDQRAAAPEPEDEAPPPVRQQFAAATPAPTASPETTAGSNDAARGRTDRLTAVLTAPPSPADIAGTPAARFAVRPEPSPPQQVAKLPESAPEARGLSRPAFLRPTETAKREDKPVEVALSDTPRSAPVRTAPQAQPIIEVPVAPFLKDEAQRATSSAAIRKPPVEARLAEAPVAPFLKAEAKAADAPAKPAVPVEPVQVAAITPPPDPAPKPQSARKTALTVPSAPAVRGKVVPEFLQREAMAPPPGLDLESRFGPNSYLAPREIPIVVRLDAVPNVPPRKWPDPAPASAALLPRGEDRPAPPTPQDTPAFLLREARDPQVPPREPPPQRDAPVQVAALPVVPRSDAPPAPTPASNEAAPPSPFGSRIPMFYVRLAEELATEVPVAKTQVAALTVPRSAAKVAPEALLQSALRVKPLPPVLRNESAAAVPARGEQVALVVDPDPVPAFLRGEARLDVEPKAAAPVDKPTPAFLSAEAKVPPPQDAPAEAPRDVVAVPEFLREEALAIESEDEAPLRVAALPERSAPAFLAEEASAAKVPEAQERAIAAAPSGEATRAASAASAEIPASAVPVPEFIRDEAQTGALATVDTPRVGDPVERAKRVTALLDAAESAVQAQAPKTVPQYYQDRAALVAELEKAGDEPAPLPFLRRAPRADAKAPIQPAPDLIVAEARRSQAPVSSFLRKEALDAQRQRAVPGAGAPPRGGETQVAARATDTAPDATTPAKRYGETAEDRRAVDAGVAAYLGRDYEKALSFWQPAATRGNPDAQFFVAGLHLDGNGVPRDLISAHVWFARSADQGHARAAEQLGLLRKIMTQDQFAEAERRRRAD
jgi:TPR repeat protein